jgi:Dyp-type peroxidase family
MPGKGTPLFALHQPLSKADLSTYAQELKLLQGNILKSHGREAAVYAFLTFDEGKRDEARTFIHHFADRVTSAEAQDDQSRRFRERNRAPYEPELVAGFYLSAKGYAFFGHGTNDFSDEFQAGLKRAGRRLRDPVVSTWDEKFRRDVHAVVLFAHDYVSRLVAELIELRERMEGLASVSSEFGVTMRNPEGDAIEHFGYVDGASQPIFFEADLPKNSQNWNPAAGPSLVLVPDPLGKSDAECGTYVVFRKLEQNVKGFKEEEEAVAEKLEWHGEEEELVGAMIVGRFENGAPVVLTKDETYPGDKNDFTYTRDPDGSRCPVFSHIRKANPRTPDAGRASRIARRGITYGDPTPPGDDETTWPERGVGLLFHCCQASLAGQFETIHRRVNDHDVPAPRTGQDPLIGQTGELRISMPAGWGHDERTPCRFGEFVRMCGGEYLFAPSIAVLRRL